MIYFTKLLRLHILNLPLILLLFTFTNCISILIDKAMPPSKKVTTIYTLEIEEISESESFIQVKWKINIITGIVREGQYKDNDDEEILSRYACIPKNKKINVNLINNLPDEKCREQKDLVIKNNIEILDLENTIFIPEYNILAEIPNGNKAIWSSIAVSNNSIEHSKEIIKNITYEIISQRMYLYTSDKKIITYKLKYDWKNNFEFETYQKENWHKSDDYWIKESKNVKFQKLKYQNSNIFVLSKNPYLEGSSPKTRNLKLYILNSDEKISNQIFLLSSHGIYRESKIGFGMFLYPVTIPLDIVTSPIQIIYFGSRDYLFILFCFLNNCSKTPMDK